MIFAARRLGSASGLLSVLVLHFPMVLKGCSVVRGFWVWRRECVRRLRVRRVVSAAFERRFMRRWSAAMLIRCAVARTMLEGDAGKTGCGCCFFLILFLLLYWPAALACAYKQMFCVVQWRFRQPLFMLAHVCACVSAWGMCRGAAMEVPSICHACVKNEHGAAA